MSKAIFISHSQTETANSLQALIREAFGPEASVFNYAKAASGLAPGAQITSGLAEEISSAKIMVWLATPISVQKSFWMAWELGVATAKAIPIIPCLALGLAPSQLPLMQSSHVTCDLSDDSQLFSLLESLHRTLGFASNTIPEAIAAYKARYEVSPFESLLKRDALKLRRAGPRLICENLCDYTVLGLQTKGHKSSEADHLGLLLREISDLRPFERKIMRLPPQIAERREADIDLLISWQTENDGRQHQFVRV